MMMQIISDYDNHNENKPTKEVLEASIKIVKCSLCGYKTEPYYIKFDHCSEDDKS